jgi:uncharacterized protein (DUF58 family)
MSSPTIEAPDHRVYADFNKLVAMQHLAGGFSFLPKQSVHSILAGRYASKLRGRGLNFEELRHYRSGDDIRTLDWKVTNRTRKPHVRVYTEERERSVLLLIDQRMSMFFGSEVKMKSVAGLEMAALSIWRTLAVQDRVGAIVFNDTKLSPIRPQRSRDNAHRILYEAVRMNHELHAGLEPTVPKDNPTSKFDVAPHGATSNMLNKVLGEAERICEHDYLLVVVSDMSGWNERALASIRRITRHNDVIVSFVYDPLEKSLPDHDQMVVSDGKEQISVDASQKKLKQEFQEGFEGVVRGIQNELSRYGVPVIPIDTIQDVDTQVRESLGKAASSRKPA